MVDLTLDGVRLSNPERELWPGVTKRDLAEHYRRVGAVMLPHLRGRPLTVRRYPRGIGAPGFVQQHWSKGLPAPLRRVSVREASGVLASHIVVETIAGLVACAQIAALEIHGWGSRIATLECPDRMVFDLDPDPLLDFRAVVQAAHDIGQRLAQQGIESWPMLSGGKGVHVVVPLAAGQTWPQVSGFAKSFASALAADAPERYLSEMSKAERRGRIFIDWLRNERGATAVMPFSPRARAGAPVAVPVGWDELDRCAGGAAFTLAQLPCAALRVPAGWGTGAFRLG